MSRNRYAVILLVVLALTLWLAGRYVNRTTATLCNELQTACTLVETGQMPQAQQASVSYTHLDVYKRQGLLSPAHFWA